jgi:hypothetical protein
MADKKEPQSYGSQSDWVSGRTDQKVQPPNSQRADFDDRRESESSASHQGGDTSPVQSREHAMPSGPPTDDVRKVTVKESGAKRGGYFKERDYEGENR